MKSILLVLVILALVFSARVQTEIEAELALKGNADIFINMREFVNFNEMEAQQKMKFDDMDHSLRGKVVHYSLKSLANTSQRRVVEYLKSIKADYQSFWVSNTLSVKKATKEVIEGLKKFDEIEDFELITEARVIDGERYTGKVEPKNTVEAGVAWVKAPEVWAKGFKGKGVVVGVIDTGAFLHNDLKNTYRGRDGNHNHNWLDTVQGRTSPYDDHFHGTHCHGTVGASSSNVTVGVATESEWISCKFLSASGGGSWENGIRCLQFMTAPSDLNGENEDSDKRPHITSNSYGGGSGHTGIHRALQAMVAAGVEAVFAAGNSARCNTIGYPARYDEALAVGALNRNADTIASFSSKGPGLNNALKPEISAPGANVLSTAHTGGYRSASGTSMACPHVAGIIALMWNARPDLARKIQATRQILYQTAKKQTSNDCSSRGTPNNVFGHGTADSYKACGFSL